LKEPMIDENLTDSILHVPASSANVYLCF